MRGLQRARVRDQLIGRPDRAGAVRRGVSEEQVRREGHAIADAAAENVAHRDAPRLSEQIETRELDCGDHLRAVVVERCGGIGEQKPHLLEPRGIAADEIRLQRADAGHGRFAAAAHFAEPDQSGVGFDFDDGANETAPVAAVRVS